MMFSIISDFSLWVKSLSWDHSPFFVYSVAYFELFTGPDQRLTHTVTHMRKRADEINGRETIKGHGHSQQKRPESTGKRYS